MTGPATASGVRSISRKQAHRPNQPINREFAPALSHLRPSNIDQAHPGE